VLTGAGMGWIITHFLSAEALNSWGWRLPFLLGLLIAPVGMWIRRHMQETEDFLDVSQREKPVPMREVLRTYRRSVLVTLGVTLSGTVVFYVVLVNMPTFAGSQWGLPMDQVFMVQTIAIAMMTLIIPLSGWLSDLVGRKPILVASTLATGVLICPLMVWVSLEPSIARLLLMQLLLCLCAEQFPTRVRSTGISVAYNVSVMIFGGFAPYFVTLLVDVSGSVVAAGAYVVMTSLVGVVALLSMREGAHGALLRDQHDTRSANALSGA